MAELPGVTVVDLAALQERLALRAPGKAVAEAQELVAQEAQAFLVAQRSAEVTPTLTALRRRASDVVDAELLRLSGRLPDLDPQVREEVTRTVHRVVHKLLHTPTVQVKRLAGGPDGASYARALRELFELNPQIPAAVAVPSRGDVRSALDGSREEDRDVAPGSISKQIEPGHTVLVAEVGEVTTEVVDDILGLLDGTVTRRPAADVYDEIQSAKAAQDPDAEARRVLREQRRAEHKDKWEQFTNRITSPVA